MLYIVSTPIWNLEDITYRAVRILKEVDFIVCEDTRTSWVLLKAYDIKNNLLNFHAHSDDSKIKKIIDLLKEWKDIALISDAWTPWISDPAYNLVRKVIAEDIQVCPIPWASAVLSAIVWSWMHMHDFRFIGFLPVKKWRQTLLRELAEKDYTVVIYESVHRLLRTLEDLEKTFWKEHKIVVARELTKKFEEFKRDSIEECRAYFWKQNLKWEFVIVF
ncbi:MAG: hypothetical protein ACD_2C00208G0007 [uncultured bacterium (gcode 4)]|uniref:Tetrapyrrole methylase domain-containing protein n=1 Tax=uncultured bacterium (gcode 4) TaxID=1234023 RepID=K2FDN7_9BACT|nr:MAG: hypothetical protein ACD_2C00208G0007 [uncultured bacterium (gcode 4)]